MDNHPYVISLIINNLIIRTNQIAFYSVFKLLNLVPNLIINKNKKKKKKKEKITNRTHLAG